MNTNFIRKFVIGAGTLVLTAAASGVPGVALANIGQDNGHHNLFIRSASENADYTQVTFPLHRGTSHGQTVWYVVTDSSDRADAAVRQVNYVPKLANAAGTPAVQQVQIVNGLIDFPATVDFSPTRVVIPGPAPNYFPPQPGTQPGAVGEAGYSPLIQMPDGTVLNAPQIANASGQGDKVIHLDPAAGSVTYVETPGFYDNRDVHYASFDSSSFLAAALEDVTYAPALDSAPAPGDESHASAREGLIAFINGQLGVNNPQRQGLNSAIHDGLSPLNILDEIPEGQADPGFPAYSALWDIHLAAWTPAAVANGQNLRQRDFGTVLGLVQQGLVTGPGGSPFGASGFIVNCPAVSLDPSH